MKITGIMTAHPVTCARQIPPSMQQHCIRRLPVEGFGRTVVGIVSMNDILLAAGPRHAVRNDEVVDTFQTICAHHHPTPHVTAA
jgi:CBS-domain-containing membrane protein